jgi:hypothetical protein
VRVPFVCAAMWLFHGFTKITRGFTKKTHGNRKISHGNIFVSHGNRKISHGNKFKFSRKYYHNVVRYVQILYRISRQHRELFLSSLVSLQKNEVSPPRENLVSLSFNEFY